MPTKPNNCITKSACFIKKALRHAGNTLMGKRCAIRSRDQNRKSVGTIHVPVEAGKNIRSVARLKSRLFSVHLLNLKSVLELAYFSALQPFRRGVAQALFFHTDNISHPKRFRLCIFMQIKIVFVLGWIPNHGGISKSGFQQNIAHFADTPDAPVISEGIV
jgi:hypothetical protein